MEDSVEDFNVYVMLHKSEMDMSCGCIGRYS